MIIENVSDSEALAALDACARGEQAWSAARFETLGHDERYRLIGLLALPTRQLMAFAVIAFGPFDLELEMIAVDPQHRRSGLAGRLIEAMIDEGSGRGMERVLLEVRASNEAARALYARHGFAEDGCRAGYYPISPGRREDAILMSRPLAC
ncbi:ribosomal-protein-alanine N-acetyltransferase [Kushneria avicenniae]|uniref:Ribosomal-protein-alanine N-acetyltransferase n=1 Tax=Kushneria avicenniae TaxID=402385 RepID=A0A1I1I2G4_9GAMM|nr:GNAT family N-acetyltransferase [Kushneria avicenniae]SFC27410.1 ribosomal-protein-alanine N-acetyltransferase [Kushneria avicenniae]